MTPISWSRFRQSLGHARQGFRHALASENNFRIHILVAVILVILVLLLRIPREQVALVVMVVTSILILELVNTVVERFADLLEPRVHPYVQIIKDLMATAVLIAAVGAMGVGLLIFWPYLYSWVWG